MDLAFDSGHCVYKGLVGFGGLRNNHNNYSYTVTLKCSHYLTEKSFAFQYAANGTHGVEWSYATHANANDAIDHVKDADKHASEATVPCCWSGMN